MLKWLRICEWIQWVECDCNDDKKREENKYWIKKKIIEVILFICLSSTHGPTTERRRLKLFMLPELIGAAEWEFENWIQNSFFSPDSVQLPNSQTSNPS